MTPPRARRTEEGHGVITHLTRLIPLLLLTTPALGWGNHGHEVVNGAALLVNPQNVFDIARGLREVLLDEALREDLRRRGYAQTQQFSWDDSVRRVLEVYRSVTLGQ